MASPAILWWGRSDLRYSRNRIVRQWCREYVYLWIGFPSPVSPLATQARRCYEEHFSQQSLRESLRGLLDRLIFADGQGRYR